MPAWRGTRALAGYRFSVEAEDPDLVPLAASLYAAAAAAPEAPVPVRFALARSGAGGLLLQDGRPACAAPDLPGLFAEAEWHLTRCAMQALGGFLQVHAAGVVRPGGAVLVAGPPQSGKTSLAVVLARAGGRLAGDEVALLGPAAPHVTPFPRDLILHEGTRRALGAGLPEPAVPAWKAFPGYVHAAPAELGLRTARRRAPVRRVLFAARRASGPTQCRTVPPSEAAQRLLEQIFALPRPGAPGLEVIARLAEECAPVEVVFSDAGDAARHLAGRLLDGPR